MICTLHHNNIIIFYQSHKLVIYIIRLNDEIINCYLSLLQYKFDPTLTKIYICNSFFFSWINDGTFIKKLHWSFVEKFFTFEIMFMPIHSPGHWSLVAINVQKKEVFFYDSLGGKEVTTIFDKVAMFLKYIQEFQLEVAGTVKAGSSRKHRQEQEQQQQQSAVIYLSQVGWKFISCGSTIPQQDNASDCGVYVCSYVANILSKKALSHVTFGGDTLTFRERMIYDIVQMSFTDE